MLDGNKTSIRIPELHDVELNLIPIMNLFTALIPFLLLSAAFFHVGVVQATVPVKSDDGETDVAKTSDKITLNLRITSEYFELSAASDTLDAKLLATLKAKLPRPAGSQATLAQTYAELSAAAFRLKGEYTASDTCVMVPDKGVTYDDVVHTMDAVRAYEYQRDGRVSRVTLFPRIVLASLTSG